ncbi:MAG: LapA family protein [Succinivibrionaceae bacterium]|nr:LapA family protein [Succinivibrionaceae bacterium]
MLRFVLALLLIVLLVTLGLYFGFLNTGPVEINLLVVKVKTSVASFGAVAFAAGFVLSQIFSAVVRFFRFLLKPSSRDAKSSGGASQGSLRA